MNDQLLSHLESFDSDEEFSESPGLVVEEHVGPVLHEMMNPFDMYLLKAKMLLRRLAPPASWKEAATKALWLLPIAIVLGDYVGYVASLSLSFVGLIVSQLQPEPHHRHEEMTGHKHSVHVREVSFSTKRRRDAPSQPISKRQVQDCRKEISRLLGLIGAPALDWSDPQATLLDDDEALGISSEAAILVVKFLEAHAQLLLAVDEAYRWLQVTASLHLGLGPRSQCVERVERASIAREFRQGRRQSIGGSLISHGVQNSVKEPQRGLCKSVLSLANVRQHLANGIVDQSNSILQVWHHLQGEMGTSYVVSHSEPLDIPDVIDLLWIKNARHQLACMLSDSVNMYCTIDVLVKFNSSPDVRVLMESSMSNARNAREYLVCNLLLGKHRTTTPLPNPNDPLLQSLLRYREQLDALSGAIWSCQQYTNPELASNEHGRAEWWAQIQQLSETCHALETEIGQRFFAVPVGETVDQDLTADSPPLDPVPVGAADPEDFQTNHRNDDNGRESPTEKKMDDRRLTTKTMVYKGNGVKSERSSRNSTASHKGPADGTTSLPPRDTVSEQQMIQELQNRISVIRAVEDDDSDEEIDADSAKKTRLAIRAPATSLFLGASGSMLSELKQSMKTSSSAGKEEKSYSGGISC